MDTPRLNAPSSPNTVGAVGQKFDLPRLDLANVADLVDTDYVERFTGNQPASIELREWLTIALMHSSRTAELAREAPREAGSEMLLALNGLGVRFRDLVRIEKMLLDNQDATSSEITEMWKNYSDEDGLVRMLDVPAKIQLGKGEALHRNSVRANQNWAAAYWLDL